MGQAEFRGKANKLKSSGCIETPVVNLNMAEDKLYWRTANRCSIGPSLPQNTTSAHAGQPDVRTCSCVTLDFYILAAPGDLPDGAQNGPRFAISIAMHPVRPSHHASAGCRHFYMPMPAQAARDLCCAQRPHCANAGPKGAPWLRAKRLCALCHAPSSFARLPVHFCISA